MNTLYTAIFGNYDDLKDPTVITPGWEYICFSDQSIVSSIWKVIKCDVVNSPQHTARYYKLNQFSSLGEKTIWMDASFIINCNLDEFWKQNFQESFTAPRHPLRDCVYEEAEACIRNKRADELTIKKQIDSYQRIQLPPHNGMISSGILMRENTLEVREFCDKWWTELSGNTLRDQLSFARIDFEMPGVIKTFKWDYRTSNDFIFTTHLNKRHLGLRVKRKRYRVRRRNL